MPTASRTRRAGGARRATALDAVMTVLAERGYENTRFADVSAASGVAISTLQNYFGSREDMLIEAMRRSNDMEVATLAALVEAESDPWAQVAALIERSLGEPESTQRILFEFWHAGIRDEEIREYGVELQARYRAPFVDAVTQGQERGAFSFTHRPDDVVDLLLAALAGVMIPNMLHHPSPSPAGFRRILLSQTRAVLGLDPE
ncbi:TetR/AcrR family transcriptional regulator [Streptomyces tsukubensis]|nr:TetR/AcrR family transcriptional regulator [Streptomyces tsukubensis]